MHEAPTEKGNVEQHQGRRPIRGGAHAGEAGADGGRSYPSRSGRGDSHDDAAPTGWGGRGMPLGHVARNVGSCEVDQLWNPGVAAAGLTS